MIIGEKNVAFRQKLGDFIETKEKKSPTSPGLVGPACTRLKLCLTQVLFNKRRMQVKCLSLFNLTRLCQA